MQAKKERTPKGRTAAEWVGQCGREQIGSPGSQAFELFEYIF